MKRQHNTEHARVNEAPEGFYVRLDFFRWVNRRWSDNKRWSVWIELGASI